MTNASNDCQVQVMAGGPALIRGAKTIRDNDGKDHPVTRPVVAVCVCGLSQRRPWCDGTHKAAQQSSRARERERRSAADAAAREPEIDTTSAHQP